MDGERAILKVMGLDVQLLDSGCCGMAGSFCFEHGEHYEVSVKCGERVLLPAVRQARDNQSVIAGGFSCQTQISLGTDRQALHVAPVIRMAMRDGSAGPRGGRPEAQVLREREAEFRKAAVRTAHTVAAVAGFAAAGALAWLWFGKRSPEE